MGKLQSFKQRTFRRTVMPQILGPGVAFLVSTKSCPAMLAKSAVNILYGVSRCFGKIDVHRCGRKLLPTRLAWVLDTPALIFFITVTPSLAMYPTPVVASNGSGLKRCCMRMPDFKARLKKSCSVAVMNENCHPNRQLSTTDECRRSAPPQSGLARCRSQRRHAQCQQGNGGVPPPSAWAREADHQRTFEKSGTGGLGAQGGEKNINIFLAKPPATV
jgi:hypothetical protein